ncbi:hypothetical protein Nepgr_003472 [Nepenthes gracilis]|uniref:WAT1-related protein n=1 Tax=Nepenthes gracilis TaxID=150966 RepID=A0AAD3XDN2_NEPGR|nr:hypothetical protein Nepgr_003472 [Nepenthes gracilis]
MKEKMWEAAVPFTLMVLMEGCTSALTITTNSAMEDGMNQFVFVAYSNALSSFILLPYSFLFHWDRIRQLLNLELLTRFFFLGLIGVIGTLISIVGAVVITVYKGPSILEASSTTSLDHRYLQLFHGVRPPPLLMLISETVDDDRLHWVIGSILLVAATLLLAVWGIIQVSTINKFPDLMLIVACYIVFGTLQTAIVDLIAERDLTAWKLQMNLELAIIVSTAIFGTLVRSRVQAWCMSMKGPMYVSMFKPFGIFWSCVINLSFFGGSLHYGSALGAAIVGMGYYTVLWGVRRDDEEKRNHRSGPSDSPDLKIPLLHDGDDVVKNCAASTSTQKTQQSLCNRIVQESIDLKILHPLLQ